MKLSKVIELLKAKIKEHGDIEFAIGDQLMQEYANSPGDWIPQDKNFYYEDLFENEDTGIVIRPERIVVDREID